MTVAEIGQICDSDAYQEIKSAVPFTPDPTKAYVGSVYVDAINSCLNGDPDRGGEPRVVPLGNGELGLATHSSTNRKLRDCVEDFVGECLGYLLMCKSGVNLNDWEKEVWKERGKREDRRSFLLKHFFDVRMFGFTACDKTDDAEKAGSMAAPFRTTYATSVHEVFPVMLGIAPSVGRKSDQDRSMGTASIIPYAMYCWHFQYLPEQGKKLRVSTEDLTLLFGLLPRLYNLTASATRSAVFTRKAYVFELNSSRTGPNIYRVWKSPTPRSGTEEPTSPEDYTFPSLPELQTQWKDKAQVYELVDGE